MVSPMRHEMAALQRAIRIVRRVRAESFQACIGQLDGRDVVLICTGDGPMNAQRGLREALNQFRVRALMVLGVAGGLSPGLALGTLLVAKEVVEDGGNVPPPDAGWGRRAERLAGAVPATLLSARRILSTAEAKAEAYSPLPGGVAAVDLETSAYARVAAERNIPYVALRVISDPAEESLPIDFDALRDETGGVKMSRVALRALAGPRLLPVLWAWKSRMALCSRRLAQAAQAILLAEAG
jgi:adenosylhomocysteine nucleosidase